MRWCIRFFELIGANFSLTRESKHLRELRAALAAIKNHPYRNAREKTYATSQELQQRHRVLRKLRLKMELDEACQKIAKEFQGKGA